MLTPSRVKLLRTDSEYEDLALGVSNQLCQGFSGGASGKEPAGQCRRLKRQGFNPWVGKIPQKRA